MSKPEYPMTTWRHRLEKARHPDDYQGSWDDDSDIVHVAPDESVLDVEFDGGFGLAEGPEVLIWTEQRVYFAVEYDGSEHLHSAPRNPTDKAQPHA